MRWLGENKNKMAKGIFTIKSIDTKPSFLWNQETANLFSSRIIKGSEVTVFWDNNEYCILDYLSGNDLKVAYHYFEFAVFVGFIKIDSGGENCQHYVFNAPE